MNYLGYRCSLCGAEYAPEPPLYQCPADGGNLDVVLDIVGLKRRWTPEKLLANREASMWRYLPLLPLDDPQAWETPLRAAGGTPVFALPRLAEKLGLRRLWLKDESRNPTASFKDRASALVVARARQIGASVVVTASTGNAGAALAGMAAAVGQSAVIFAPRTAPPAKVAQLLVYGAQVLLVDGSYDQAFDLSVQAAAEFGWYCRNTGYNPFTAEGKKTAAFEIWDWLRQVEPSLAGQRLNIFVSVGDGNIIAGIHKGLRDLQALGWLEAMPRLFGVQAAGSAAVANAFAGHANHITPVQARTLADSISVDLPRDGWRALQAVRQTAGQYLTVSDDEILAAIAELGPQGVFAEPAAAAAYAGLRRALSQSLLSADEPVLVLNTGSGLKDVRAAAQAVAPAPVIPPQLAAVRKVVESQSRASA